MVSNFNIENVYGADIASISTGKYIKNDKITWLDCMAHDISLKDATVEYITSFDCLEHCLPEDIDLIVNEFYRVCSKGLLLKIAYRQANERSFKGEVLHMTVQPENWWIEKFSQRFTFTGKYNGEYLLFTK
jgi:ubiquinone/menaquinone biosynthesis C-methylase UbiE